MKDLRKTHGKVSIDADLLKQGELQLLGEIALLEQWLKKLEAAPSKDAVIRHSITTYQDMLRSRQDMLAILRKQDKQ